MQTTNLLIAFVLSIAFLLSGCSVKDVPVFLVPDGALAGDRIGLNDGEFQPPD